jgi:hypothetical protein
MPAKHLIQSIGAHFGPKDIEKLEAMLDERAKQGYELVHVFQVEAPGGCLGFGRPVTTNLAVFRKGP